MLELVDRHTFGSLAGDGLVVAGDPLPLVVGAVTGLTDEEVDLVDPAVRCAADVIGIDLVVEVPPAEGDRVGVSTGTCSGSWRRWCAAGRPPRGPRTAFWA